MLSTTMISPYDTRCFQQPAKEKNSALTTEEGVAQLACERGFLFRDGWTTDQFRIVLYRVRPTQQIALDFVASFVRKKRELSFGLDTFCGYRQSEPPREANDRADNGR